jgi:hypothetical protein
MKKISFIIVLTICLTFLIIASPTPQPVLKTGTITFEKIDAANEAFTIKIHTLIPPNSRVLFTDTEWNGTHFGIDEHTMIWYSGKDTILSGNSVHFKKLKSSSMASIGYTKGQLKIAFQKDAIFAYQGTERMPTHFIAGIAYHIADYGTLQNTGLIIDSTALILP